MAKYGDITSTGQSGTIYQFEAYSWDAPFDEVGVVYIITGRTVKPEGGGTHARIYIGQTADLSERFDNHHKISCFERHNANCICIHVDNNENSRRTKEADLIAGYRPPCND